MYFIFIRGLAIIILTLFEGVFNSCLLLVIHSFPSRYSGYVVIEGVRGTFSTLAKEFIRNAECAVELAGYCRLGDHMLRMKV